MDKTVEKLTREFALRGRRLRGRTRDYRGETVNPSQNGVPSSDRSALRVDLGESGPLHAADVGELARVVAGPVTAPVGGRVHRGPMRPYTSRPAPCFSGTDSACLCERLPSEPASVSSSTLFVSAGAPTF